MRARRRRRCLKQKETSHASFEPELVSSHGSGGRELRDTLGGDLQFDSVGAGIEQQSKHG